MKQVREGWVVFDKDNKMTTPMYGTEDDAWDDACGLMYVPRNLLEWGYTCRRVRVTIEELNQTEKAG